jgi:hypothetical protein
MTPVEKLREFRDVTAYVPQPAPEPHQQQGFLDRIGQLEQALAASERREHSLRSAQAKLRQAHARQKSLNASLVKSTSWRLTAPLRSASMHAEPLAIACARRCGGAWRPHRRQPRFTATVSSRRSVC